MSLRSLLPRDAVHGSVWAAAVSVPLVAVGINLAHAGLVAGWQGSWPSYGQPDPKDTPYAFLLIIELLLLGLAIGPVFVGQLIVIWQTEGRRGWAAAGLPLLCLVGFWCYFLIDPFGFGEWTGD